MAEAETFNTALIEDRKNDEPKPEPEVTGSRPYRVTVEPVLLAVYYAWHVSDSVLIELYLKRTCQNQLQLNSTVCDSLGTDTDEGRWAEEYVQPFTADYQMWRQILQSIVPAILSLFLGPWTDTYGRKPVLISTIAGEYPLYCIVAGITLTHAIYVALTFIPDVHPAFMLLGTIPLSLMGGYLNLVAACYCYISDISLPATRSFRLGLLEGSLFAGILLGLLTSSFIFDGAEKSGYGFTTIFAAAGGVSLLALIYVIYLIPESVNVTEPPKGIRGLVNISLPVEMAKTCFKARPENRRAILFLCYTASGFVQLIIDGEAQVEYLFSRLRFGWDLYDFTIFSTVAMSIAIISTVGATWLLPRYLKVSDPVMSILSFATDIGQGVMYAVALPTQAYFMYVGAAVASLRGVVGPCVTSILSTTVPSHETGKVFALSSSIEAIMPVIASPIYVNIYNSTLDTMPGVYYLVSAGLYAINAVLMGIIALIQRKHKRMKALQVDTNTED